ncbi:MAG: glutamate--cysteine ligase [Planctomycetia bacterium]|nr:glutamate--cysteine ligase [Planctomycetia bacterium]
MASSTIPASPARALHLFDAYGVELEYMVVHQRTLNVMTAADVLLRKASGGDEFVSDVTLGDISASNEMTAHVIELKTTGPATSLAAQVQAFQTNVRKLNAWLSPLGGQLLPTAMHPWMDPLNETKIWPHQYSQVYTMFNRIFNCQGHGWSNLQSVHLNLPFTGDEEFGRLHAAVRLLLPIMPALAASSPIIEDRSSGSLDTRLTMYRNNSRRIPSIAGRVIPEPVYTEEDYRREILQRMYDDVQTLDPQGILRHEWLNGRGAIARFERSAIEIRLLDVQECPAADLAVLAAIVGVLKRLVNERWTDSARQRAWEVEPLERILDAVTRDGEQAVIQDLEFLRQFGLETSAPTTAGALWRHLIDDLVRHDAPRDVEPFREAWHLLLEQGPLARRILRGWDTHRSRERLVEIYRKLGECLAEGRLYQVE